MSRKNEYFQYVSLKRKREFYFLTVSSRYTHAICNLFTLIPYNLKEIIYFFLFWSSDAKGIVKMKHFIYRFTERICTNQ